MIQASEIEQHMLASTRSKVQKRGLTSKHPRLNIGRGLLLSRERKGPKPVSTCDFWLGSSFVTRHRHLPQFVHADFTTMAYT